MPIESSPNPIDDYTQQLDAIEKLIGNKEYSEALGLLEQLKNEFAQSGARSEVRVDQRFKDLRARYVELSQQASRGLENPEQQMPAAEPEESTEAQQPDSESTERSDDEVVIEEMLTACHKMIDESASMNDLKEVGEHISTIEPWVEQVIAALPVEKRQAYEAQWKHVKSRKLRRAAELMLTGAAKKPPETKNTQDTDQNTEKDEQNFNNGLEGMLRSVDDFETELDKQLVLPDETWSVTDFLNRYNAFLKDAKSRIQSFSKQDLNTILPPLKRLMTKVDELREKYHKSPAPSPASTEPTRVDTGEKSEDSEKSPELRRRLTEKQIRLNQMLDAVGLKMLPESFESVADFEAERIRASVEVSNWVLKQINQRLKKDASRTFIPTANPQLWGGITMATGMQGESKGDLDFWLNNIPEAIDVYIGGHKETRPFLGETVGYLVDLVRQTEVFFKRAVLLHSYATPKDYVKIISGPEFNAIPFDKSQLAKLITKDRDAEAVPTPGNERNKKNSVYRAYREIKHIFVQMTNYPSGSDARELREFLNEYQTNNMYPVSLRQEAETDTKGRVSEQEDTFEWVKKKLLPAEDSSEETKEKLLQAGDFSEETIELAFRWVVADIRATGFEEELDRRASTTKDGSGNVVGISNFKVMAVRSMTRIFHSDIWARFSVEEKGTGRSPVATRMSSKHPSFGLPAEMNWLTTIRKNKTSQRVSLFEVFRDRLWDDVDPREMPEDPNSIYAQHLNFMALPFYEMWFMDKDAKSILPELGKIAHFEPLVKPLFDHQLARIIVNAIEKRGLTTKERDSLLERLYSDNPDRRLITYHIDEQVDFGTATSLKDAGDYSFDNTALYPPNFERMFRSVEGELHDPIMESVKKEKKPMFAMWTFFSVLLMAELERYMITPDEEKRAKELWNLGELDLLKPIETKSKRHALHWGQRQAIKTFLLAFQAGLPKEYMEYSFNEEHLDVMFKKLGISGSHASRIADLQWLLTSSVIKGEMKVKPKILGILDKLYDMFGYDEGTT